MGGSSAQAATGGSPIFNAASSAEQDAWRANQQRTGLRGAALKSFLDQEAQQAQFAQFFGGFGGGSHQPSAPAYHTPSGPSEEEQRITTGGNDLQSLYGEYTTAAEDATTYVNELITTNRSNAALTGVDYSVTDEQKSTMINDRFATIFSAEDYDKLQTLNTEFNTDIGTDDDPYTFLVTRGVASGEEGSSDSNGVSSPTSRGNALTSDDEETLGTTSILGG